MMMRCFMSSDACSPGSVVLLNVLGCRLTYQGQAETNAEAWFNIASRSRKPEGSLGRTAQDGHRLTQLLNYECCSPVADIYIDRYPFQAHSATQVSCLVVRMLKHNYWLANSAIQVCTGIRRPLFSFLFVCVCFCWWWFICFGVLLFLCVWFCCFIFKVSK